jgi:TatD DNase family protein
MLDIHTHLYWESYDDDRDEVIARARENGIEQMLVVGTTVEESKQALELASQYDNIFASVGIHPNEFRKEGVSGREEQSWEEELRRLAVDEGVIAIGECGLDYSESHGTITHEEKQTQSEAFLRHISLATELHLPLIVHCRPTNSMTQDAYEDLYQILKADGDQLEAVVLHCYMGDTVVTRQFLALPRVYFSFTGNITYPVKKHLVGTKDDLTETVKLVPLEKVFVETDCPFLAPQEMRGKRNEPAYAAYTAEKVCELLDVTRTTLDEQLRQSFCQVFKKMKIDA